jgi:hypothetical protein
MGWNADVQALNSFKRGASFKEGSSRMEDSKVFARMMKDLIRPARFLIERLASLREVKAFGIGRVLKGFEDTEEISSMIDRREGAETPIH